MSIFPPFAVVVRHKHENRKTDAWEVRLVIWLSQDKNVYSAEIGRQIAWVKGEGTMMGGSVRKWCRLFKEGRIRRDRASPSVDAHESKSSSGKISRVLHTSPTLAKWVSLVSSLKRSLSGQSLKSDRETKDFVQNWLKSLDGEIFFFRVRIACFFPKEMFVRPESEKWRRDKRRCAELAEGLESEFFFFQWKLSKASPVTWLAT